MALVNLTNIVVLDNPTSFTNPFTFEITFECIQELEDGGSINQSRGGGGVSRSRGVGWCGRWIDWLPGVWSIASHTAHSLSLFLLSHTDLEWKVLYVSSAEDAEQDQVLEEVMVGPVPVGINKFVLQADAPDPSRIPEEDIIGVTVILITCSYREQEFVRVGYYVNNEYTCVRARLGFAGRPASYLLLFDGGHVFRLKSGRATNPNTPTPQHPNTPTQRGL